MYVREVYISNVKLLRDVRISFLRGDAERMWTVLVGENGLCKTTILQAIGLAASGRDRANQLVDASRLFDRRLPHLVRLPLHLHPRGGRTRIGSTIQASFSLGLNAHQKREHPGLRVKSDVPVLLSATLGVEAGYSVFWGFSSYLNRNLQAENWPLILSNPEELQSRIRLDPITEARARNLGGWFVAGYGVDRRLPEPNNAPKMVDPAFQRMAPLFERGPIVGTGFADLLETKEEVRQYAKQLRKALLKNSHMLSKIHGLELRGRGGTSTAKDLVLGDRFGFEAGKTSVKVPATWLSQGYQATIAWIADLIGQVFWDAGRAVPLEEMEGLVLIDELDLHLHPSWQVVLVRALKETFPRVQFVVTTHSPMVLPGLEQDEILRVRQDEKGSVVVEPVQDSPAVMTGSELYETFFGINGLYPTELGEALRKYGYLSGDPYRSDDEQAEMERIQAKLSAAKLLPDWTPVAREDAG